MIIIRYLKILLFCDFNHRGDPCSFATIPNALKQCAGFANNHLSTLMEEIEGKNCLTLFLNSDDLMLTRFDI
jgi:hypothetical protein